MAGSDVELLGVKNVVDNLNEVDEKLRIPFMRASLRKGAGTFEGAMQRRVPYGKARYKYGTTVMTPYAYKYRGKHRKRIGTTRRAITIVSRQESYGWVGQEVTYLIGVTAGPKAKHDAFYAFMVELGTSKAPKRPWMEPAFHASKARSLEVVQIAMERKLTSWRAKQQFRK